MWSLHVLQTWEKGTGGRCKGLFTQSYVKHIFCLVLKARLTAWLRELLATAATARTTQTTAQAAGDHSGVRFLPSEKNLQGIWCPARLWLLILHWEHFTDTSCAVFFKSKRKHMAEKVGAEISQKALTCHACCSSFSPGASRQADKLIANDAIISRILETVKVESMK